MSTTIDITPTWGEFGNIATRLAMTKETKAFKCLLPDIARAFASAEALKQLTKTLTEDQRKLVATVLIQELTKQGF